MGSGNINKRSIGTVKEECAVAYLESNNYQIIEKNFRTRYGEIDIIAMDGECLVFVEVKFRSSVKYGYPEEAVDSFKQRKIINTALFYMNKRGILSEYPCRFDVITILNDQINHTKNAFTC